MKAYMYCIPLVFLLSVAQVRGQEFPTGTIVNSDGNTVQSKMKDGKDKGRVKFRLTRLEGMWGKEIRIYKKSAPEKFIVHLEFGKNQADLTEISIDKRSDDFKEMQLILELGKAGTAGRYTKVDTWPFDGDTILGKEILIEWEHD